MAGAAATVKPSPAFFFFFLPLRFLLKFLIVSFLRSFMRFTVEGDRCRPPRDLLLTFDTCELRTVLTERERGDLRLFHSRGVGF